MTMDAEERELRDTAEEFARDLGEEAMRLVLLAINAAVAIR